MAKMYCQGYGPARAAESFKWQVEAAGRLLAPLHANGGFDLLVCIGTSGSLFVSALRMVSNIPTLILRKRNDNSHNHTGHMLYNVESHTEAIGKRFLFVDDNISSGMTVHGVRDRVDSLGGKLVGCYLYEAPMRKYADLPCLGEDDSLHFAMVHLNQRAPNLPKNPITMPEFDLSKDKLESWALSYGGSSTKTWDFASVMLE